MAEQLILPALQVSLEMLVPGVAAVAAQEVEMEVAPAAEGAEAEWAGLHNAITVSLAMMAPPVVGESVEVLEEEEEKKDQDIVAAPEEEAETAELRLPGHKIKI